MLYKQTRAHFGRRANQCFICRFDITVYNVRFNRLINKCATMAVWLILAVLGTIPDELAQYWYTACTVAQQKRLPFWKLQLATRSVLLSQNCRAAMRTPCALCSPITTCTANLYREWWPSCFISVQQKMKHWLKIGHFQWKKLKIKNQNLIRISKSVITIFDFVAQLFCQCRGLFRIVLGVRQRLFQMNVDCLLPWFEN